MSETKEAPKPTKQESQGILKKLTSGDTWVSPFRSQASEEDLKRKSICTSNSKNQTKLNILKFLLSFLTTQL